MRRAVSGRKFKVLVSDPVDQQGIDILRNIAEVDIKTKMSEDQLCEIIGDYDALMVRSGTQVTDKIIYASKKLKIIGRAGVGVDNVNVKAATERGIFVVNSPMGNTVAAAEHTIGLMFALARMVPAADASIRSLKWERNLFMGSQLQGKTLGIVGLGMVGSHVAKVCREVGMRLVTYDPYVNAAKAAALDCEIMSFEDLLQESDFVTLHIPLVEGTKNLLNEKTLALMKPTARIINCSRGGVVNEKDLCEALAKGKLAGAALDVFEVEKAFPAESPLLKAPNLILTPHLGASTAEAQVNVALDVAQQICETLKGNMPDSAVNIPGLRAAELQSLRGLIQGCDTLGRIAVQLLKGPLEQVSCVLEGSYADEKSEPLMLATAKGALSLHTTVPVNFVNVRQTATANKVILSSSKEPQHSRPAIKVVVKSSTDSASLKATLTEDEQLLLMDFKGVPCFMPLPKIANGTNNFVYSKHLDVPMTLSKITGALGQYKANIGDLHLGRTSEGGERVGICISAVDGAVPQEAIEELSKMDFVKETTVFRV